MIPKCPNILCDLSHDAPSKVVRNGYFKSDYRKAWIQRFRCQLCGKTFSEATFDPCYRQKKRHLNDEIFKLLNSPMTQRRMARHLDTTRSTILRKFLFLAAQSRMSVEDFLKRFAHKKAVEVQFDEMETFEHTNAKPLSIALMVTGDGRKILGFEISRFRPKTRRLGEISRKKYGFRPDERKHGLNRLMSRMKLYVDEHASITSDQNTLYPNAVRQHFPHAEHTAEKSRRAAIVGQGELKEKGYDPLFALNHTCAMIRANVSRLVRRTWCTTKKIKALEDHLYLYMDFHNQVLTPNARESLPVAV